jgi:hypothetical protein
LVFNIRGGKDFLAGVLYVVIGAAAVAIGQGYTLGTAAHMGPGYFPVLVGILLLLVGAFIAVRGFTKGSEPWRGIAFKPLLLVLGAVCLFGLSIERFGLPTAVLSTVVIGYLANPRWRPLELALLAILLTAACIGIFVYGLKLPFNVWPFPA